jgi:hypothetical protein
MKPLLLKIPCHPIILVFSIYAFGLTSCSTPPSDQALPPSAVTSTDEVSSASDRPGAADSNATAGGLFSMSRPEFKSRYGTPVAFNNTFGSSVAVEDKDHDEPVFRSGPFFVQVFFKKVNNEEVVASVTILKGSADRHNSIPLTPLEQTFWVSAEFPSVQIGSEFYTKPIEDGYVYHKFEAHGEHFLIVRREDELTMTNLTIIPVAGWDLPAHKEWRDDTSARG